MNWFQFYFSAIALIATVCCSQSGTHQVPARLPEPIYDAARNYILTTEDIILTGGRVQLTEKEQQVDTIIKNLKEQEFNDGLADPTTYAPGMHFFQAKELIEASPIFKILKIMPKGAVLHGHNSAMTSSEWVIKNLTYWPNLMKCVSNSGVVILTFRQADWHGCTSYALVSDERQASGDPVAYDAELETYINLYTPHPEIDYPDINAVWSRFQNMFSTNGDLITFRPAFVAYTTQLLEEMYADNIMYIEFRTSFSSLYEANGTQYTKPQSAAIMKQIIDDFKSTHADFIGVKCIYSPTRNAAPETIQYGMDIFTQLNAQWPDWVIGFDLVSQEDLGKPLHDFLPELRNLPVGAKYFFHAGETNWYGTSVDENLIDALLLGTTRIGHGYAITKHPVVMNAVKNRGICIEVSPISNQVLHLVEDLRNHPASVLTANDVPFVISNDDPGYWNAKGLSYDFYYAFMSFSPEDASLAYLKQLVWRSLQCSILLNDEIANAGTIFQQKWDLFLDNVIAQSY